MATRAEIEAIFQRHGQQSPHAFVWREAVITELLTLCQRPEPSWEELENIIQSPKSHYGHNDYKQCSICLKMVNALMAWARGEAERPRWCRHIRWDDSIFYDWMFSNITDDTPGKPLTSTNGWRQCPLCSTPRPEPRG